MCRLIYEIKKKLPEFGPEENTPPTRVSTFNYENAEKGDNYQNKRLFWVHSENILFESVEIKGDYVEI